MPNAQGRRAVHILGAAALALVVTAACARAQSFGSFQPVTSATGISETEVGNNLTVTLGTAPSFVIGGVTYNVDFVFGAYALDSNTSTSLNATGSDTGNWTFFPNNPPGTDVAGWQNNPKNDVIGHGQTRTFTFTNINTANITDFGLHVSLANGQLFPGTQGITGFIRFGPNGPPPSGEVPEPSLAQLLLAAPLAGLAIARRKLARR